MEEVKRRRHASRIWVSRVVNRLETLLAEEDSMTISIQKAMDDLDIKLQKLDSVQSEMELLISEEEMENFIIDADSFLESARQVRDKATIILTDRQFVTNMQPASESSTDTAENEGRITTQLRACVVNSDNVKNEQQSSMQGATSGSNNIDGTTTAPNIHLPKIQINKFDGEFSHWSEFWDKYEALIDKANIPTISKFSYLQSLLTGEAYNTIRGLSLTEANYETACVLLKERFGNSERIINSHIQKLLNLEIPNVKNLNKLWQIYNELKGNIRSLENLNVDGRQYGVVLTPIVLSRLPREFRLTWARKSEGKEGDLNGLLDFLKMEITTRERSETYSYDQSHHGNNRQEQKRVQVHSAAALQMNSCPFSDSHHQHQIIEFCGSGTGF